MDRLWRDIFPNDPPHAHADIVIPAKQAVQPELFLVAMDGDTLCGTIMAGYDGHRGWLYKLAVAQSHQRRGIGAMLVHAAEDELTALGCIKINLQVRRTNLQATQFWQKMGYGEEAITSMGKRIL